MTHFPQIRMFTNSSFKFLTSKALQWSELVTNNLDYDFHYQCNILMTTPELFCFLSVTCLCTCSWMVSDTTDLQSHGPVISNTVKFRSALIWRWNLAFYDLTKCTNRWTRLPQKAQVNLFHLSSIANSSIDSFSFPLKTQKISFSSAWYTTLEAGFV